MNELELMKHRALIKRSKGARVEQHDGLTDPVPSGSPMHTAQLIGALVIRFVLYAQSGITWNEFPDKPLLDEILANSKNREVTERHLVALLFHHSKILDNCGTPEKAGALRLLTRKAFPKVNEAKVAMLVEKTENPEWEIV